MTIAASGGVVERARAEVPRVEVRAEQHDLVRHSRPGISPMTLADSASGRVRQPSVNFTLTGPRARRRVSSAASGVASAAAGISDALLVAHASGVRAPARRRCRWSG